MPTFELTSRSYPVFEATTCGYVPTGTPTIAYWPSASVVSERSRPAKPTLTPATGCPVSASVTTPARDPTPSPGSGGSAKLSIGAVSSASSVAAKNPMPRPAKTCQIVASRSARPSRMPTWLACRIAFRMSRKDGFRGARRMASVTRKRVSPTPTAWREAPERLRPDLAVRVHLGAAGPDPAHVTERVAALAAGASPPGHADVAGATGQSRPFRSQSGPVVPEVAVELHVADRARCSGRSPRRRGSPSRTSRSSPRPWRRTGRSQARPSRPRT